MIRIEELDELLHAARYVRRELWELSLFSLENLTDDQRTRDQIEAVEKAWIVLDAAIRNTEMAAHQPRLAKPGGEG